MATPTNSMIELAEQISVRTKQIAEYLKAQNLPEPSLTTTGNGDYIRDGDTKVQQIREELRGATRQLDFLVAGHNTKLLELSVFEVCLQRRSSPC